MRSLIQAIVWGPLFFFFTLALNANGEPQEGIKFIIEIKMDCPMSKELQTYMESIPTRQSVDFEEWRNTFIYNMRNLIRLVESGKINHTQWLVKLDETQDTKNSTSE